MAFHLPREDPRMSSHLTNKTQRREGTHPRAHSKSAAEPHLGSSALSQETGHIQVRDLLWAPG